MENVNFPIFQAHDSRDVALCLCELHAKFKDRHVEMFYADCEADPDCCFPCIDQKQLHGTPSSIIPTMVHVPVIWSKVAGAQITQGATPWVSGKVTAFGTRWTDNRTSQSSPKGGFSTYAAATLLLGGMAEGWHLCRLSEPPTFGLNQPFFPTLIL